MEIRKEYNVQELAEKLKEEIDNSKKYNGVVKLDVITTLEILDVLLETHRREQKHQTIESALIFDEKEEEKPNCFGVCMPEFVACKKCKLYSICYAKAKERQSNE